MEKIITSLLALLLATCLVGQTTKYDPRQDPRRKEYNPGHKAFVAEQKEYVKQNAQYVFEAKIIRSAEYSRPIGEEQRAVNVRSLIVQITRVFRGNLKPGKTVEIIERLIGQGLSCSMRVEYGTLEENKIIIAFCDDADLFPYNPVYNIDTVDYFKKILAPTRDYAGCINFVSLSVLLGESNGDDPTFSYKKLSRLPNIRKDLITRKDTVEPMYDYGGDGHDIKTYTMHEVDSARKAHGGRKGTLQPALEKPLLKNGADSVAQDSVARLRKMQKASYEYNKKLLIEHGEEQKKNMNEKGSLLKAGTSGTTFTASIVNQQASTGDDGTEYFEFDVQATVDNSSLYYYSSSFWLKLPADIFTISTPADISKISVTNLLDDYSICFDTTCYNNNKLVFFHVATMSADSSNTIPPNCHQVAGSALLYHVRVQLEACASTIQLLTENVAVFWNSAAYVGSAHSYDDLEYFDTFNSPNPAAYSLGCYPVTGISITGTGISTGEGGGKTLVMDAGTSLADINVTLQPSNLATYTSVNWNPHGAINMTIIQNSSNNLNATITAITAGKGTLTASVVSTSGNTYTDTVTISVRPVITSIDNPSQTAGDRKVLTIHGKGFGSYVKDSCVVQFMNADKPGDTLSDGNMTDFYTSSGTGSTWTDTKIEMFIPSMLLTKEDEIRFVESGKLLVKSYGVRSVDSSITIKHNYQQYTALSGKRFNYLPHSSTILFRVDPSLTAPTVAQQEAMKMALAEWSCKLNITLGLTTDTTCNNLIRIMSASEYIMNTQLSQGDASRISGNNMYPDHIIIEIDANPAGDGWTGWNDTIPASGSSLTTAYNNSFYHAFLHEIGHALVLGHVSNESNLMYYNSSSTIGIDNTSGGNDALADEQTRVSASTALGWLTNASPTPTCPMLPEVKNMAGTARSSRSVGLTWNEVDPDATVTITRTGGVSTVTVTSTTGTTASYTDNTVTAGETYTYTIIAQNTWATRSATAAVVTTAPSAAPSGSIEIITWPPVPGASGYKVERSTSPTGSFITIGTVSSGDTTFSDATVTAGETYYYQVITTYASGSTFVSQVIMATTCISSTGLASTASISGTMASGSTTTKQAQAITSSGSVVVSSGATLKAEATQTIGFRAGFSAKTGSTMTAHIVPVCGTSKAVDVVDSIAKEDGNEVQVRSKINVFPNPTGGIVTVTAEDESFRFELYNNAGILVKKGEISSNTSQIDMSTFATGIYYLNVVTKGNEQQTCTLVKK